MSRPCSGNRRRKAGGFSARILLAGLAVAIVVLAIAYAGAMILTRTKQPAQEHTTMPQKISGDAPHDAPQPQIREEAAMPYLPGAASGFNAQAQIASVLRDHERILMAIDGVVGVAAGRTPTGDDAIILYLKDASVRQRVPASAGGYPVETVVSGEIDAYPDRGQ